MVTPVPRGRYPDSPMSGSCRPGPDDRPEHLRPGHEREETWCDVMIRSKMWIRFLVSCSDYLLVFFFGGYFREQ